MQRKLLIYSATGLALLAGVAFAQDRDQNVSRCEGENSDIAISGCTALIQSGRESGRNLATIFYFRGLAYVSKQDYDRAILDYNQTINLNPVDANAIASRGNAYLAKEDYEHAFLDLVQVITLNVGDLSSDAKRYLNNTAWKLATGPEPTRNGTQAVVYAQKSVELTPNSTNYRDTLAASYAEDGQFELAVEEQQRAIQLLGDAVEANIISDFDDRLNLYLAGQPY